MDEDAVDTVLAEYYLHVEETSHSAGDRTRGEPERDLWPGIEARLSPRIVSLKNARARWWVPMLAAASLLIVAMGAVTYMASSRRALKRESHAQGARQTVLDTVASHSGSQLVDTQDLVSSGDVEAGYDREIAALKTVLEEERSQLDTATVRTIEDNLRVIDEAVRESRAALAKDPKSVFLGERLARALATKVRLLRMTSRLSSTT